MSALISKITGFFGVFSGDMIFLVTIFVIFLAYGLYLGRGKLISLIIAFYPATLFFNTFPFTKTLIILHTDKLLVLNKIGIFLLFLIPLNIIVDRFIFSSEDYSSSSNIFRNIGLTLGVVVLIVLFSYNTINFDMFHNFSPTIDTLFSGNDRLFYWNLAPIALLAVL